MTMICCMYFFATVPKPLTSRTSSNEPPAFLNLRVCVFATENECRRGERTRPQQPHTRVETAKVLNFFTSENSLSLMSYHVSPNGHFAAAAAVDMGEPKLRRRRRKL